MEFIRSGIEILRSRRSLAVVAGEKHERSRRTDKSRTLKNKNNKNYFCFLNSVFAELVCWRNQLHALLHNYLYL